MEMSSAAAQLMANVEKYHESEKKRAHWGSTVGQHAYLFHIWDIRTGNLFERRRVADIKLVAIG
jgi:hypothetical protein